MKTRRQHKSSRRLMAFLLSLALVMADMPILTVTALAEEPETVAEQDSSSGDAGDSTELAGEQDASSEDAGDSTEPAGETEGVNENGSTPETTGAGNETNGSGEGNGVMGLSDESTEGGSNTETPAANNTDDTSELVYTLESSTLTAFSAGGKSNGETETAGTENYFTIIYSEKSKVDSSSKTFDDGYSAQQRLNLGGKVTTEKNAVKFTTNSAATVTVWWVEGGDDNRQMAILNAEGEQVAVTEETLAKNATCISTFELTEAGTYYLGGATNNNYIFKIVVTEEEAAEPITSTLDASDLATVAEGAKADGNTEEVGTDGFFTILYSAKTKIEEKTKEFEDGFTATKRINFGGAVSTEKNAVKFTTNSSATVTIWWGAGDADRQMAILNASGEQVAITEGTTTKDSLYKSTLELTEAGTYYLGGTPKKNYISKIEVVESNGSSSEKETRATWADVAAPEITDVTVNADSIDVTVKMEIGYDGADSVTVSMTDANGETTTKKSSKEGSEVTLNFIPTASGTYTFSVVASREDEEDKAAAETKSADFVLPLTAPVLKSATSKGSGSVEVAWNAVDEAESYIVSVVDTEISATTSESETTITGLTIDQKYTFSVVAVRGAEKSEAGTIEATVKDEVQREWVFAAFGQGITTAMNTCEGSVNDEGTVTITSGNGKIVPGSNDGLAFYYTTIDPETENFTLTADIHVNNWKFSNGQEGFGLMVADAVAENGYGTNFWNNSYQALASKIEYTTDEGNKISMKLGIGATVKTGTTAQDVADITAGKITMSENFSTVTDTLETSCASLGAGTYNIIGNYTGTEPTGCQSELLTDITLQLQRNNTGYYLRYLDSEGNVLGEQKYYDLDRDSLTQIDEDNIYIGFFASRNARITVSNIELTIISPEDDEEAEERETEYVDLTSTVESAAYANSASYEFVYVANADGVLNLTDDAGNVIFENYAVTANEKVRKTITLTKQTTKLTGTFTPNADYKPSEYSLLSSYDAVTVSHTITLQTSSRSNIYVSPNGTAGGTGTKDDPMSIYQAVKVAAPGTRIYIMEGTYYMNSTLKVERGINGTADAMIYMIADPDATSRPVFDFQQKCAGMVLAGDYWYFQGFDVTNSADAQKGIQVSGDHNVLDRICTYKNGNTGLQISRYLSTDEYEDWPAYNTILNCSSYLNADKGYEDADGFAAKLTVGDGNVFDGCIAAYNADDGWDLFAKVQTGSIGVVTIQNCLAFKNGYVLDDNGNEVDAGNGNGFKMGGDSMPGAHILKNSIAFGNKAKGIDSNSGPDIQVYDSISFNNESYNVALYTNTAVNTNYIASGIVSFKTASGEGENLKFKGTQDETLVKNATNFFFDGSSSTNTNGVTVTDSWFESVDMAAALSGGITRNANGTINMNGFLVLTDVADDAVAGAVLGATASPEIEKAEETADDSNNSNNSTTDSTASDNDSDGDDDDSTDASQTADSTADTAAAAGVQTPAAGTVNGQQYAARDNAQTVPETQNGQATEIAPEQTPTTDQAEQDQTIEIQPEAVPTVEIVEQEAAGGSNLFGWALGILALLVAAGGMALMVLRKKEQDAEN